MTISIIAAVAKNGVIGKDKDLVWDLPDDMQYFVDKTRGRHVIMGRNNYESIPHKYRPLPNRTNIIITRQKDYEAPGCTIVNSLKEALDLAKTNGEKEAFIIGGGEIYKLGLSSAHRLYITEIDKEYEGDTWFPKFDQSQWHEVSRIHHPADSRHEAAFDFVVYER